MTTVTDIFAHAAREIGGRTGTMGTVTVGGSTTTTVLNGLVNTTGDDTAFAGDRLFFLEGATSPRETLINTWDDSAGLATYLNLTSPAVENDEYILVKREDYSLAEFDAAWSQALAQSRRTYRQVVPITPNLELYPLSQCDWLRGAADIDAVWISNSPIMLHNEDFSLWQNGASAAPDGWTLAGADATVERVTGGIRSPYAARVTSGAGAAATLYQSIPTSLVQWITRRESPVYTPMRGAGWVTTSASNVRVGIYDGSTTTWATVDANGYPVFSAMSLTPTTSMTDFRLVFEVPAGEVSADFHAAVLMQNTTTAADAFAIRDEGSQAYVETQMQKAVRNVGGIPTVELSAPLWTSQAQLIVYVRRPFPQLVAYDDVIDDQYARALEYGLLTWLLSSNKPNQSRERLDRILDESQQEWARFLANIVDLPVPRPPTRAEVWPA